MFKRKTPREPVAAPALFDYAVGSLGRRMRTEKELRRLMSERAFPGEQGQHDMDAVILKLKEFNYLSDARFASDFTRLRKENQGFGRRRVAQDLAVRGVGAELAGEALATAFDGEDEVAAARAYCERKRIKQPQREGPGPEAAKKLQKDVARIMNRLVRAGYSADAVFKLMRAWRVEVPDELPDDDQ